VSVWKLHRLATRADPRCIECRFRSDVIAIQQQGFREPLCERCAIQKGVLNVGGLYNALFGMNPAADVILGAIGLTRGDTGRFRDAFVANGEIAVYTRNGGGNRMCVNEGDGTDCGDPACYACAIEHRLPKHPLYLRDEDDDFDATYATIYFKLPERFAEKLKTLETGKWEPGERWKNIMADLQSGKLDPAGLKDALDKNVVVVGADGKERPFSALKDVLGEAGVTSPEEVGHANLGSRKAVDEKLKEMGA